MTVTYVPIIPEAKTTFIDETVEHTVFHTKTIIIDRNYLFEKYLELFERMAKVGKELNLSKKNHLVKKKRVTVM